MHAERGVDLVTTFITVSESKNHLFYLSYSHTQKMLKQFWGALPHQGSQSHQVW